MTAPAPKWPSDLARKRNNRRLIAERTGWPEGALQACADLEDRHPGWHVSWMSENTGPGFERPAGFWASHPTGGHAVKKIEAFAATAEELVPLLVEVPEHCYGVHGCEWCLARLDG
jgi:hypothetical protein